jgi:hypothetical protein
LSLLQPYFLTTHIIFYATYCAIYVLSVLSGSLYPNFPINYIPASLTVDMGTYTVSSIRKAEWFSFSAVDTGGSST